MSTFSVQVVKIDSVEHHPDADRLSIIKIGGYNCISAKLEDGSHRYAAGDLVVYIPEAAVLSEWMLKKMGFWKDAENKGTLAGSKGDRVKAIRLRGIFSQGVLYPVETHPETGAPCLTVAEFIGQRLIIDEGIDVAGFLGITKYDPPVPVHMAGEVASAPAITLNYDIQNIQKYDKVLEEGEEVVVTEKLHGTWACMAYVPGLNNSEILDGEFFATSKGMSGAGRFFKNNDANANNLYHKQLLAKLNDTFTMTAALKEISKMHSGESVYVLGEIFGDVQDLKYGVKGTEFRVFDIFIGTPSTGRYLNDAELETAITAVGLKRVPVLYHGPFSMEKMIELRDGNTMINDVKQIREGIVIRTAVERENKWIGRVQLKFVSPAYLLRKGEATEFN